MAPMLQFLPTCEGAQSGASELETEKQRARKGVVVGWSVGGREMTWESSTHALTSTWLSAPMLESCIL
jgi:hypothetical protein